MAASTSTSTAIPSSSDAQKLAADPKCNVWVSASAGSGKTKVLVDRLARLLLQGTDPSKILCLTFTRVAALEMRQRLLDMLQAWATMSPSACHDALSDFIGKAPSPEMVRRAQELFQQVQEALPGMAIKTFHSFCQGVLQTFALEAGVPIGFTLIEGAQQTRVLTGLKQDLLMGRLKAPQQKRGADAKEEPQPPSLHDLLKTLSHHYTEASFLKIVDSCIAQRPKFQRVWASYAPNKSTLATVSPQTLSTCLNAHARYLGLTPSCLSQPPGNREPHAGSELSEFKTLWQQQGQPLWSSLEGYTSIFQNGTVNEKKIAELSTWLGNNGAMLETSDVPEGTWRVLWDHLQDLFLTKKGLPRAKLVSATTLKRQATSSPALGDEVLPVLDSFAAAFYDLYQKTLATRAFTLTHAVHWLSFYLFNAYETYKNNHNALDFNDCILATQALLDHSPYSPGVLHALSQDIYHILMDEAQDTSPEQWSVMLTLITELLSADNKKTFFIVGDGKQSIYGFQGADYKLFFQAHTTLANFCAGLSLPFRSLDLTVSYRSTPCVLKAVDEVMNSLPPELRQGLGMEASQNPQSFSTATYLDGGKLHHTAHRASHRGKVHRWPLVPRHDADLDLPGDASSSTPDTIPDENLGDETHTEEHAPQEREQKQKDAVQEDSENRRNMGIQRIEGIEGLAWQVAHHIQSWLDKKVTLPSTGLPIQPGDIMILIRRRSDFIGKVTQRLKMLGIPVEGDDRLHPWSCLALRQLYALGRWVTEPYDDFSLASVLKSPMVGVADQDVFELHQMTMLPGERGGSTLWEKLQHKASLKGEANDTLPDVVATLKGLQKVVASLDVYQFFTHCLASLGWEDTLVDAYGPQVQPYIALFLTQAMQFTLRGPAGGSPLVTVNQRGGGGGTPSEPSASVGHSGLTVFLDELYESRHQTFTPVAYGGGSPDAVPEGDDGEKYLSKVRIMTVHGSKGLQAPVVILPDATDPPRLREALLWDEVDASFGSLTMEENGVLYECDTQYYGFVCPSKVAMPSNLNPLADRVRASATQEHCRLLYVAMTRAQDHLFMTGLEPIREAPHSWYRLASALPHADTTQNNSNLGQAAHDTPHDEPSADLAEVSTERGLLKKRRSHQKTELPPTAITSVDIPLAISDVVHKAYRRSAPQMKRGEERTAHTEDDHQPWSAEKRGVVIHKILERAPYETKEDLQHMAALVAGSYGFYETQMPCPVIGNDNDFSQLLASWIEECWRLQQDPEIARLLALPALIEQPLLGYCVPPRGNPLRSSSSLRSNSETDKLQAYKGRIDRLCYDENTVYILDYKSAGAWEHNTYLQAMTLASGGHRSTSSLPQAYKDQLDFYATLVQPLVGSRDIKKGVIYTNTAQIIWYNEPHKAH